MTGEEALAPGRRTGGTGPLPFDTSVAHQARMYDYLLGGKDNYAADREAAEAWLKVDPDMAFTARANRAFLGRAVRYLAARGGDPAVPRHRHRHPDGGQHPPGRPGDRAGDPGRVRGLRPDRARPRPRAADQQRGGRHRVHRRRPARHRHDPRPGRPSCWTSPSRWRSRCSPILHAIPDADDPHAIVARLMDAVPSGSYLAVSHLGSDLLDAADAAGLEGIVGPDRASSSTPHRSREQVAAVLRGHGPGGARAGAGRGMAPGPGGTGEAAKSSLWGAVGRKR